MTDYQAVFKLKTASLLSKATNFINGLFATEHRKRNIERMCEKNDEDYQSQQHFITYSPWDALDAMKVVAQKTNKTLGDTRKQCLLIDESSHKKAGRDSVAVSRQHNGNLGKIENSQTGVFAALAKDANVGLVRTRLFIPQEWIDDKQRCLNAGIPNRDIVFKTKPQLAVEMISELDQEGINYGWVGADALYGRNFEFREALEKLGKKYVLDIQKDHPIYIDSPNIFVPAKSKKRGRQPSRYQTDTPMTTPDLYVQTLDKSSWKWIEVKQGTKGKMKAQFHFKEIWVWQPGAQTSQKLTLIIKKINNEIKYSLSNFCLEQTTEEDLAYMQVQRHLVEKSFKDTKGELGLFDYQIRKHMAWYHHMALVMITMHFTLEIIVKNYDVLPLVSVRDVRLQIIEILQNNEAKLEKELTQMIVRHQQRAVDIVRRYIKFQSPS